MELQLKLYIFDPCLLYSDRFIPVAAQKRSYWEVVHRSKLTIRSILEMTLPSCEKMRRRNVWHKNAKLLLHKSAINFNEAAVCYHKKSIKNSQPQYISKHTPWQIFKFNTKQLLAELAHRAYITADFPLTALTISQIFPKPFRQMEKRLKFDNNAVAFCKNTHFSGLRFIFPYTATRFCSHFWCKTRQQKKPWLQLMYNKSNCNIVYYKSMKSKRMIESVPAPELFSMTHVLISLYWNA